MFLGCTAHHVPYNPWSIQEWGNSLLLHVWGGEISCKWECYTGFNFVAVWNSSKCTCRFTNNIFVPISAAVTSSSGEISEAVQTSTMLLFSEDLHKMESSTERSFPSLYFHVMGNHVRLRIDMILSLHSTYKTVASCSLIVLPFVAPKEMMMKQS